MAETFEGLYVKFGANTVEFDRSVKVSIMLYLV